MESHQTRRRQCVKEPHKSGGPSYAPKRRYRSVQFVCHSENDRAGMYTESSRHSSWAEDAKDDFVVKLVQAQQGTCKWWYPLGKCPFRDFPIGLSSC